MARYSLRIQASEEFLATALRRKEENRMQEKAIIQLLGIHSAILRSLRG